MLRGPGHAQRPPRRNTGLIVGGSIAAVLLVAGIIVGVSLSGGGDDKGDGSSGGGTTSPSDGTGSTKTAHLAAALTAPGGGTLRNAFFSPDGKYVVAAGSSSDAYVWKAGTHQRVQTVSIGSDKLYPAAFSADDKTLYLIDDSDYELYSANIATGETSRLYYLPLSSTWYATWGSEVFAVVNTDGSISEYNMPANKAYAKVTNPGSAAVALVRPAADGKYVLIADKDGSSYLVEAKTGHVAGKFHYDYSSTSGRYPSVSLDGNTVYVPGEPGDPGKLWDRKTGTYITPTGSQWPNPDNGGTFAVDSQHIMTSPALASQDVDIWTIASRAHDATVVVPGSGNEQIVSIGPGAGQLLSTGGYDTVDGTYSTLNLWDLPK
jgi:WD40 repeat protein